MVVMCCELVFIGGFIMWCNRTMSPKNERIFYLFSVATCYILIFKKQKFGA